MSTPRLRDNPPFTRYVVERRIFEKSPFTLVDVGAGGGIEQHRRLFGDSLAAFGFEPLIAEAERLNAAASNKNISYHAYLVTSSGKMASARVSGVGTKIDLRDDQPFSRTSAVRAMSLLNLNYAQAVFDPSGTGKMTEEKVTLDRFFSSRPRSNVDFLKIDTDGHDYDVLCGAEDLLVEHCVLGVFIESQFHGPVVPEANLFSNIDQFLRARGFSLFDLEVYRYSRSVLPRPFVYNLTAQTHEGQVLWGDALYLRDAGDPDYEKMWDMSLTPQKVLKLACLYEIYGLEDCAAELLCKERSRVDELIDVEHCLNLLTPVLGRQRVSFREYNERFQKDPTEWFPDKYETGENDDRKTAWRKALKRVLPAFLIAKLRKLRDWSR